LKIESLTLSFLMSWKIGSQLTKLDVSVRPSLCASWARLAMMFMWLTITPFGDPVEPDVY